MGNFGDETIKILQHVNEDIKERHSDQKSDKSKHMFRDEKYQKRKKHGEFHVGGNYFRIEIVCLHGMDKYHHSEDGHNNAHTTIIVSDYKDRNRRKKSSENRNKSKDKNNHSEGDDIGKSLYSVEKTDDKKPDNGKYRVREGYNRLCLKDESEPLGDLPENDTVFFIEKRKIPPFQCLEIIDYLLSVYQKDVAQDKRDKKLCEKNSDVFYVLKGTFHNLLNRCRIENIIQGFIDTEIHIYGVFQLGDSVLKLIGNPWSIMDKTLSLLKQMRDKRVKKGGYHHDKGDVHESDDYGER